MCCLKALRQKRARGGKGSERHTGEREGLGKGY